MEPTKTCFVIAPIGQEGTDIRRRSDQILKYLIRPSLEAYEYSAVRADEIDEVGMITSQVIQHILDDDLVIADLTGHNPNVFYELAIRHVIRRPVVQIIEDGEKIPFDLSGLRTLHVNYRDLDSVGACVDQLKEYIAAIQDDPNPTDTPVSVAVDLQQLRKSDNPAEKGTAEILESLAELRQMVSHFEQRPRTVVRNTPDLIEVRAVLRELATAGEIGAETLHRFITSKTTTQFDSFIEQIISEVPEKISTGYGYSEEPF